MKIIVDNKIPEIEKLLNKFGQIILKPGQMINKKDLIDAELLLVRSVTKVDENLLAGTSVKFIASATAGVDHIDENYLKKHNIIFNYAGGCNANAVSEYVICCVAGLRKNGLLKRENLRAGVIGIGHVGSLVTQKLKILGFEVLCNDPPRAAQEPNFKSTSLENFDDLDLICVHTPLTTSGEYPTHHLIDEKILSQQKKDCIVINAGRGAVINEDDLLNAKNIIPCLDVWQDEPMINYNLLTHCKIATPHIAGYSHAAKYRATQMIYESICEYLNKPVEIDLLNQTSEVKTIDLNIKDHWEDVVLQIYNPLQHTELIKKTLAKHKSDIAHKFVALRHDYKLRPEFNECQLINNIKNYIDQRILKKLGFHNKLY